MIQLTSKEKKWNCFLFLPSYFIFGQYLFSFLFLLLISIFNIYLTATQMDALFNLVYMVIMSFIAFCLFNSYLKKSVHHMKGKWLKQILYACTGGAAKFYLFNIISSMMIILLNPDSSSTNQQAIMELTNVSPLIMIFTTVIVAPFLEEMVFRVGIFQMLYEKNRWLAYIASSLSFGFVHIMAGLFSGDLSQLLFLFPYSLLGFVLCQLYEKRDSIFVPMIVHAINNAIAMLAIL